MKDRIQDLAITVSAFSLLIILAISLVTIGVKTLVEPSLTSLTLEEQPIEILVKAGDSLWSIAREIAPHKDPREVIYTLQKVNQLDSAKIYPGQVLVINHDQPRQALVSVADQGS